MSAIGSSNDKESGAKKKRAVCFKVLSGAGVEPLPGFNQQCAASSLSVGLMWGLDCRHLLTKSMKSNNKKKFYTIICYIEDL